jgi:ribosomal protein S18 acetylase RimI-like enzyme
MEPELVTKADFDAIVAHLPEFWGDRDVAGLHHPMFVHEFGDTALVILDEGGSVAAYLFGFVLRDRGLAYIHLIAVREDQRGRGLGRALYDRFRELVCARGCWRIKAITSPSNTESIAFHRALGMEPVKVDDYAGTGKPRIVFSAELAQAPPN